MNHNGKLIILRAIQYKIDTFSIVEGNKRILPYWLCIKRI
jgi:hypothetical protein